MGGSVEEWSGGRVGQLANERHRRGVMLFRVSLCTRETMIDKPVTEVITRGAPTMKTVSTGLLLHSREMLLCLQYTGITLAFAANFLESLSF
jgi:hypothetical protein